MQIKDLKFVDIRDDGDYIIGVTFADDTYKDCPVPAFALSSTALFERAVGGTLPPHDSIEDDLFYELYTELVVSDALPDAGIKDARALMDKKFTPVAFVVEQLVPEGLTLVNGKPKVGKSWLALQIALAVASGGKVLNEGCARGRVLYLALEDSDRRMQQRIKALGGLPQEIGSGQFEYVTTWQALEAGGFALLQAYIAANSPRLVIIDVLQKLRTPGGNRTEDAYQRDYRFLAQLHRLAQESPGLAILVVHHEKKGAEEDFVEAASGSFGLTGVADGVISLQRKRGSVSGELHLTHRDTDELGWSVKFEQGRWSYVADLDEGEDASGPIDEAREFLLAELRDGRVKAAKVKSDASANGISSSTLKRAKSDLGIKSSQDGGAWWWALPDAAQVLRAV